ncbi:hypothetical protein [Roseimaritima multifibrata]|uniref:hypothetical protein n=1 Tax=Roseimaritima multifibrata TaxID=1930274 RepID=UPI0011A0AD6A|nr:hypothetical protein [Roseimaritima multifibrata]
MNSTVVRLPVKTILEKNFEGGTGEWWRRVFWCKSFLSGTAQAVRPLLWKSRVLAGRLAPIR